MELVLVSLWIVRAGCRASTHVSYLLLWPIILICTPGPSQTVQSIMFALNAPVRYGPVVDKAPQVVQTLAEDGKEEERPQSGNGRREAVAGGDVVRDCAVIE